MEKLYDVLVVGELNVDLILDKIEKFPEVGKEVIAGKMTLTLGSSSAIFASNIASLGARVAFIGKIGNDKFGEIVLESLQKKKVDISMIKIDKNVGTGATVVLNVDEDRANTTYPGAMDHLTINDITEYDIEKARHLHFSSYFLQPGMWGNLGELFRKAKKLGLTTSFDMQWDPKETWELDIADVLPNVDIFLPNEKEIMFLTGKDNLDDAINSIKAYTNILIVKRGNKGSLVHHKGQLINLQPFLNSQVVDSIGAGDSFNAGYIYKFINGHSIEECQKFGNLTGAVSTTAAGGTAAFEDYEIFKKTAKERFGVDI
ncbi:MAG: carbohydrate kinase [Bacteroidetes bacterium GWF2_42_66]|nr:MAG: carbohydrate kinase [Bacteroidetes bacterium GWA2_42_15]OFY03287.1 MAG: carbohydrate kinase [Bacteroidetes bacterium GWE2_42_39]OFY45663.1 MAG: carbohydrate kinase [Bacteroidetes bacterium GWF2_42_66]HBL77353.1 carbohydrate kinase family protein [Prolixibacteraceae bacterium]HCU62511.1 carbohydrate kinase family protein [Prolixibacteraceae bacterium]